LYKVNFAPVTLHNILHEDNYKAELIPAGNSLEKYASSWVEGEFWMLYIKAEKCGIKKKPYFYMTDNINEEKP
jgi:hypothetical protein